MIPASEWRKWLLQHLIGEGVNNVIPAEQIRKKSGRHYDINLDHALRTLKDDGIIMSLDSNREKRFVVNYDKLDEAQEIINSETESKEYRHQNNLIQPFMPEPEGYVYWFDNKNDRKYKKQNIYNIYFKKTDKMNFAAN